MELSKIRNLSDEDLKGEQARAGEQLFRIRFQKSLGNQEGIKKLRGLKLDIARIKTVERERAIAEESKANPTASNVAPAPSTRTERHKAKLAGAPKSAGTKVAPESAGTKVAPESAGTKVAPKSAGTKVKKG